MFRKQYQPQPSLSNEFWWVPCTLYCAFLLSAFQPDIFVIHTQCRQSLPVPTLPVWLVQFVLMFEHSPGAWPSYSDMCVCVNLWQSFHKVQASSLSVYDPVAQLQYRSAAAAALANHQAQVGSRLTVALLHKQPKMWQQGPLGGRNWCKSCSGFQAEHKSAVSSFSKKSKGITFAGGRAMICK